MVGIKESKEALEFVAELVNACDKALADGVFSLNDAIGFLPMLIKAPAALSGLHVVKAEIEDYSEAEMAELAALFKAKLNIKNDSVEANIEAGLEVVLNLAKLLASVKAG
jgi:hypothetical protein